MACAGHRSRWLPHLAPFGAVYAFQEDVVAVGLVCNVGVIGGPLDKQISSGASQTVPTVDELRSEAQRGSKLLISLFIVLAV